jgi:hypothetical protein
MLISGHQPSSHGGGGASQDASMTGTRRESTMTKGARRVISFLVVFLLSRTPVITGAEEPVGLTLRKGTIVWKATLQQARSFIEEDMRPDTSGRMKTLGGDTVKDDNKFSCEKTDSPGVLRCNLACCVDLDEGKTLRFATLYFHNDQFYHYKITFPVALYQKMAEATKKKYGKPTKSEESTITMRSWLLRGTQFDNLVEQWKLADTLIVLQGRGGGGKIFLSSVDVYHIPIYRQILENQPKIKTPY